MHVPRYEPPHPEQENLSHDHKRLISYHHVKLWTLKTLQNEPDPQLIIILLDRHEIWGSKVERSRHSLTTSPDMPYKNASALVFILGLSPSTAHRGPDLAGLTRTWQRTSRFKIRIC